MKFKPLHDRVLIEVLDSSEKTAGGIIIPDTAQEKPQEGKVVAVGGGAKTEDGKIIPMDVKVGDKVLFGKWSGTEVKIGGKEYSIMKESDIMGISTENSCNALTCSAVPAVVPTKKGRPAPAQYEAKANVRSKVEKSRSTSQASSVAAKSSLSGALQPTLEI